jgi:hypothetical protein
MGWAWSHGDKSLLYTLRSQAFRVLQTYIPYMDWGLTYIHPWYNIHIWFMNLPSAYAKNGKNISR